MRISTGAGSNDAGAFASPPNLFNPSATASPNATRRSIAGSAKLQSDRLLADLRWADFHTPLTKEERAELQQILASIPDGRRRREAEGRLQDVLAPKGRAPQFEVKVQDSLPVLAQKLPASAHPDRLIKAPNSTYTETLAHYLTKLAGRNPDIANGIASRAGEVLDDDDFNQPTRPIALAIACHLVANPELGPNQPLINELAGVLKDKRLTCPITPAAAGG